MFLIYQPEDGQWKGPKHVVVLYVTNDTYLYHHIVVLDRYANSKLDRKAVFLNQWKASHRWDLTVCREGGQGPNITAINNQYIIKVHTILKKKPSGEIWVSVGVLVEDLRLKSHYVVRIGKELPTFRKNLVLHFQGTSTPRRQNETSRLFRSFGNNLPTHTASCPRNFGFNCHDTTALQFDSHKTLSSPQRPDPLWGPHTVSYSICT